MKKMREIEPVTKDNMADVPEKDRLIDRLQSQNHVPIPVGRAIVVIEQCEPEDEFPKGSSDNPLKISIYSDPDVSGLDVPCELFIHAGRYGFSEVFLRPESRDRLFQLMLVEASIVEKVGRVGSNIAKTKTVLALLQQGLTGLYYEYHEGDKTIGFKQDEVLAELGREAHVAVKRYLERLRELPNVWSGYYPGETHD